MPAGAWIDLDLLRRRRQQLGLETPKPVPARALIWRGGLVGGGVVFAVVLACAAVWLISRWLEQRQTNLAPAVAAYEEAQARIGATKQDVERLQQANQALAEAIAGVRSGSAVLTEISRVIPHRLQLTKLKVQSSSLELSGTVLQPLGLDVVNGFQLRLEASPFFQPDGVTLVKAVESAAPAAAAAPAASSPSTPTPAPVAVLNFDLTAAFTNNVAKITAQQLLELGSVGSARRRQLLQREGLLK
ncbi:MAG: PilN domain-containing protein [Cyanobacteria bacterium K_DeepCast_35m_m1_288]|nr:PilN domain-containing protein [Cyanobacteria bacterium K_DeepCast_35m_m1_288]